MEKAVDEVVYFLSKAWVWFALVMLGIIAKFSIDIFKGKKITIWQALASVGIAFFVGFITSIVCVQKGWEQEGMWIVPCATLVSDKIVLALMAIDYKKEIVEVLKGWLSRHK